MSCFHPFYRIELKAFENPLYKHLFNDKEWENYKSGSPNVLISKERYETLKLKGVRNDFFTLIKCNKCIGCREDNKRQWTYRLMLEWNYFKNNSSFLTLTYSDENLKFGNILNNKTGELVSVPTLNKRDIQLFMKRLRKYLGKKKIKYFCCGEYGTNTKRPHYHLIIFGEDFKKFITFQNRETYESQIISDKWNLGNHLIGEVNNSTIKYVSGYCLDKQNLKDDQGFKNISVVKPFLMMSKGIGLKYFIDNFDLIKNDMILIKDYEKSYYQNIPDYYKNKLDDEQKDLISRNRKKYMLDNFDFKTDKGIDEYNKMRENIKNTQNKNKHKPL